MTNKKQLGLQPNRIIDTRTAESLQPYQHTLNLSRLWACKLGTVEKRIVYHHIMNRDSNNIFDAVPIVRYNHVDEADYVVLTDPMLRVKFSKLHTTVEVVELVKRFVSTGSYDNTVDSNTVVFATPAELPTWVKEKIAVLDVIGLQEEVTEGVGVKVSNHLYWISNMEELSWRPQKQK